MWTFPKGFPWGVLGHISFLFLQRRQHVNKFDVQQSIQALVGQSRGINKCQHSFKERQQWCQHRWGINDKIGN